MEAEVEYNKGWWFVYVGSVVSSERRTRALKNHVRISARKKKVETRKRSFFPRTMRVTAIVKRERAEEIVRELQQSLRERAEAIVRELQQSSR